MRINRQSALRRPGASKPSKAGATGTQQFSIEQPGGSSSPALVQGTRPIGAVDALLALQEVPDATTSSQRAVRHGEDMLDALEDVQMGLVVGAIPKGQLTRLLSLIRREQERDIDPKLGEVLKEIELRAHVELAKLGEFA